LGWCYQIREADSRCGLRNPHLDSAIEGQPELELRISDLDGAELGWVGILREADADFGDVFISASGKVIAPVAYPGSAMICPNCGSLYRAGLR
jgi:hypothetical protein